MLRAKVAKDSSSNVLFMIIGVSLSEPKKDVLYMH